MSLLEMIETPVAESNFRKSIERFDSIGLCLFRLIPDFIGHGLAFQSTSSDGELGLQCRGKGEAGLKEAATKDLSFSNDNFLTIKIQVTLM